MPNAATDTSDDLPPALRFLAGGGRATELILARDWSGHRLGDPSGWPEALKATLSTILNSPESMILAWGRDDLTFFFNETYFPLLGPRLSWAMGSPFHEVWADAWEQAKPIIDDAFEGRSQRFTDLPWKLGTDRGAAQTWFTFSYSRVLDGSGEIAGLFIFTNETTTRVLADRALATSQAKLRALNATLEAQVAERTAERDRVWRLSRDLLGVADANGRWLSLNPAWTRVLGWTEEELLGKTSEWLEHPDDRHKTRAEVTRLAAGATTSAFENRFRTRAGDYRWLAWSAVPENDLLYCTARDITAEKQRQIELIAAQDQLRQAQKVEAVGQLTGGVAHDFNNLLTVIRGSADLLNRPDLTDERRSRHLHAIIETADRATKLTRQLLAFARRQALLPEMFDAEQSVRSLTDMIGTLAGSRIRVDVEAGGSPCRIHADRSQFETAIINIAVNARDAMNGEGTLTIRLEPVRGMPAMRMHSAVAGDFVAISLTDTGEGIPADRIDHIFEPFFTTKGVGQGTGLGLSQVFGFAKQSGGDVMVESEPGRGTTFTLYLPRSMEGQQTVVASEQGETAEAGEGACILVVEDNPEVGEFARSALAELGYTTVLATNAARALDELEAATDRFDVVFSDVVMPGMSGVDLGREVRLRYPGVPVILTSGYSNVLAEDGSHGFELIHKPYSIEQLSAVLQKTIRGSRRRSRSNRTSAS